MATSVANVMFTNAVYFPNYKIYSGATPGMMNYSCISHVFYAFASLAADGSVFVSLAPPFPSFGETAEQPRLTTGIS